MELKKINSKIIDGTLFFQETQIEALYEKLLRYELHPKDEVSCSIQAANRIDVKALSTASMEKFQNLYGHLHKINTDMMIDTIVDQAQYLKQKEIKNPQAIGSLRKRIGEIWQNNTLSEINTHLLHVASLILEELSSGKTIGIQIEEMRSTNQEEAELAFELLDIANLFYQGKISEGIGRVKRLPSSIELPFICETASADEIGIFIQKAVVKSFEMGRKDGYTPSSLEIQAMLKEAADLS